MSDAHDETAHAPLWRRYLRFWRSDPGADVADEVRFHLESAMAEFRAAGMDELAAAAEARKRFGNVDAITQALHALSHEREEMMRRKDWLDALRQDLRIALRRLRRSPGFAAVVTLTLALGIGANSAIFSVVHAVLLRPLPYRNAERLLNLREGNGPGIPGGMFVTFGNYGAWVERARSFEAFGAWFGGPGLALTGAGEPQQLRVTRATASYWRALYISPAVGRYFDDEDVKAGARVVVLSHGLWQSAFGGDSAIVGRAISLGGEAHLVRGVAAREYALTPQATAAWIPLVLTPQMLADHSDHELSVVGLVRSGVDGRRAIRELTGIQRALKREHPKANFDGEIVAVPYLEYIVGSTALVIKVLFGAVALVLVIACVNIANLLLARAAARRKEIAVRGALGAGRKRIVVQLMVESLVLAGSGALVGIAVAAAGARFLTRNGPQTLPRLHEASLDGTVVLFTAGLALACGVAFGLLPAVRASRLDLQTTLRDAARPGAGTGRQPLRAGLVVVQVAMALLLLMGAGLLVRSALLLQRVPPGFEPSNVLAGTLTLPNARYPTDTVVAARYRAILAAAAALPGVGSAALVSRIPIGGFGADCAIKPEGATDGDPRTRGAHLRTASSDYFTTLGIPLLYGRTFTSSDGPGAPPVVVINRRLAAGMFGTENAVGRRVIGCGPFDGPATVIGITGDVRADGLAADVRDQVHYASAQLVQRGMTLVVRGDVPVMTLLPGLRRAVSALDPQLPIALPRTMDEIIGQTLATPRFQSTLLAALGGAGLLLAIVGIYGVIALLVVERTPEFGLRLALGAERRAVLGMVVRQGVMLASLGIVIGAAASLMATRVLRSLLFQVDARDPVTLVAVAILLIVTATLATLIPALRATRVDPVVAMRG